MRSVFSTVKKAFMINSFWMVFASFFYALYALFLKFASIDGLSSFEVLFYRSLFGLILISVIMTVRHIPFSTPHPVEQACRGCLSSLAIISGALAIAGIDIGMAQTLNNTTPLFIGLFVAIGAVVHGLKCPYGLLLSLIVGFAGVILMVGPSLDIGSYWYVFLALVSAFAGAFAMMYINILTKHNEPGERILFYLFTIGTVTGLVLTIATGGSHVSSFSTVLWILGFCLSSTLMQTGFTFAFGRGDVGLSGFLQYLTIPFSVILGFIFLDEEISLSALLGMCVIVAGGIMATLFTKKERDLVKKIHQVTTK